MRSSLRFVSRPIAATVLAVALLAAVPAGPAGAAPHRWTLVRPGLASPPRAAVAIAYDPISRDVVTFGGYDDTGAYSDQTWIWDGTEWAQPIVQTPPPARASASMAYDATLRKIVLFGGYDGSQYFGDTWLWDGATLSWTQAHPAHHPTAVTGPAVFPDPLTGHVETFGGFDGRLFQNQTWQWTGSDWVQLQPGVEPGARGSAIAELDRANHTVVLFSGLGDLNVYDTWTWDGTTWTHRSPAHQPPSRFYSSSAYAPSLRGVVIFGGGSGFGDLNDTWAWTGTDWHELDAGTPPAPRESQAMAYDPVMGRAIMFGGQVSGHVVADTWSL